MITRGKNQVGTIDYNPVVRSLGTNRRPEDVNGIAGTSASILQYHVVRGNLVSRPDGVAHQTICEPSSVPGGVHAFKSGR